MLARQCCTPRKLKLEAASSLGTASSLGSTGSPFGTPTATATASPAAAAAAALPAAVPLSVAAARGRVVRAGLPRALTGDALVNGAGASGVGGSGEIPGDAVEGAGDVEQLRSSLPTVLDEAKGALEGAATVIGAGLMKGIGKGVGTVGKGVDYAGKSVDKGFSHISGLARRLVEVPAAAAARLAAVAEAAGVTSASADKAAAGAGSPRGEVRSVGKCGLVWG